MTALRTAAFRLASAWRRSLWVLPALVVLAGVALAGVLAYVDPGVSALQSAAPRILTVSPDSARGVLTAIATSMLSVAGVVFSITIATLSLTSQQFTSRVLRTFVRDRGNQLVLGVFLGVFAYCLVVLRFVSSPSKGPGYAPQLAVLVGIGLAFVGVGFLIYFIDHVADFDPGLDDHLSHRRRDHARAWAGRSRLRGTDPRRVAAALRERRRRRPRSRERLRARGGPAQLSASSPLGVAGGSGS